MINKLARHTVYLSLKHNKPVRLLHLNHVVFFTIGLSARDGDDATRDYLRERYDNGFGRVLEGAIAPTINARYETYGDENLTREAKYFTELSEFDDIILELLDVDPDELTKVNLNLKFHKMWKDRLKQGMMAPNWTFYEIEYDFKQCKRWL